MKCPNCGQEENERFCSNCGTPLDQAAQPQFQAQPAASNTRSNTNGTNPAVEKFKATSQGYGKFFLDHLKQPTSAKSLTDKDFLSGVITIGIFALISALITFITIKSTWDSAFFKVSFLDAFIKPFISQLILLFAIPAIIFGILMVLKEEGSFQTVIAKFGGYLIPFLAVSIVGSILSLLDIYTLTYIFSTIGNTGIMLIIPALILFEKTADTNKGLDRIYLLFIVIAVIVLVSSLLGNMFSGSPLGGYEDILNEFESYFK